MPRAAPGFTFAAYGQLLAVHGTSGAALPATAALTSLGYSGEHFDAKAQQQYLRARWYNPANGQFNRLDPFAGDMQDPQSLHKYAYVHGDPVQGVDPTGLFNMPSMQVSLGIGIGIAGTIGVAVGYTSKNDGGFWQSIIPGFGAGRGLGKAIAEGDPLGIGINAVFLALDLLTVGGWSAMVKGASGPVLKHVSRETIEALYRSVTNVARDPQFITRAVRAGVDAAHIERLIPAIDKYVRNGKFGISESRFVNWTDEDLFALTEKASKSWSIIAHELTHVLDGVRNPRLLREGGATALETMKAEYRAFYVMGYNPAMSGARSFAQFAIVNFTDGRFFFQGSHQFFNAYFRWYDGDEDMFDR
ncbi:MAG TPA: hypothetical protein DDZ51_04325 [Planctomycetaceae bacterium]|nr:hypothetical protein [Planctomycetaceae bacterium]